jgi:hypothetical protein
MAHRRSPVEMLCVRVMPSTRLSRRHTLSWLGECGSVVDPTGCETSDDLRLQFGDESLGVVVCERSCPVWVVAGLVLVAADPLECLGELGQVVEGDLWESDFGDVGDVSELVAVAGVDGGVVGGNEFAGDVAPVGFVVEIQALGEIGVFVVDGVDVELVPEIDEVADVVEGQDE